MGEAEAGLFPGVVGRDEGEGEGEGWGSGCCPIGGLAKIVAKVISCVESGWAPPPVAAAAAVICPPDRGRRRELGAFCTTVGPLLVPWVAAAATASVCCVACPVTRRSRRELPPATTAGA